MSMKSGKSRRKKELKNIQRAREGQQCVLLPLFFVRLVESRTELQDLLHDHFFKEGRGGLKGETVIVFGAGVGFGQGGHADGNKTGEKEDVDNVFHFRSAV